MADRHLEPNFTTYPNLYLDQLMAFLTPSEVIALNYLVRRIFGFHKEGYRDTIAISQFEYGISTEIDGEAVQLDYGTGLTRSTIERALAGLYEFGIVTKDETDKHRHGITWGLQLDAGKIDFEGLFARDEKRAERYRLQTAEARQAQRDKILSIGYYVEQGNHVEQGNSYYVEQGNSYYVEQAIQKKVEIKEKESIPPAGDDKFLKLVTLWEELLPDKPSVAIRTPKTGVQSKLESKLKARLRDEEFRKRIVSVIKKAARSPYLLQASWFTLEYILRNDENWRKVLDGVFDSFDKEFGGAEALATTSTLAKLKQGN